MGELFQVGPQPVIERQRKSLFGAVNDFCGKISLGDPSQSNFCRRGCRLERDGKAGGDRCQMVIQKGGARFEAEGHGGVIGFQQKTIRQAGALVRLQREIERGQSFHRGSIQAWELIESAVNGSRDVGLIKVEPFPAFPPLPLVSDATGR